MPTKEAKALYDREYRAKNKARIAEAKRAEPPGKQAARSKKWAGLNPEKAAAAKRAYRERNYAAPAPRELTPPEVLAERARVRARAWSAANPQRKAEASRAYQVANREAIKSANKARYDANKEARCEYSRAWAQANPERAAATRKAYRQDNPEIVAAALLRRKRRVERATPPWADNSVIRQIYMDARASGMDVDHVIPIKGKLVSGLHVETNLQLLTPGENKRKNNKFLTEAQHAH
jgi:5-methylcytosine-specific restriction endonuclease McrA